MASSKRRLESGMIKKNMYIKLVSKMSPDIVRATNCNGAMYDAAFTCGEKDITAQGHSLFKATVNSHKLTPQTLPHSQC